MKNIEMIFGKLRESKSEANLKPNEFTFMIDRKDATFMGSIVNINGTLYENGLSGDGLGKLIRDKAEEMGFKFKTPMEAGLYRVVGFSDLTGCEYFSTCFFNNKKTLLNRKV